MRISIIFGTKMVHLSWTKMFWYKPLLLLSSTYRPFSLCKILKKFLQQIQNYDDAPFLDPKWSICPKHFFFWENYYYHSHLPISPFHSAKFKKKSSCRPRVMRMCSFLAQNGPFPQMTIFSENLLMSLVSFIYANLNAKNQSQILIY